MSDHRKDSGAPEAAYFRSASADGPPAADPVLAEAAARFAAVLGHEVSPHLIPRPDVVWHQRDVALDFLVRRSSVTDAARRVGVILHARPDAPELERLLGGRATELLNGREVRCAACKRTWTATPEEPYLNGTVPEAEDATPDDGLCCPCLTKESRTDDAIPVLTGTITPTGEVNADDDDRQAAIPGP